MIKSDNGFHCFALQATEIPYTLDIAHKLDWRKDTSLCQKSAAYFSPV